MRLCGVIWGCLGLCRAMRLAVIWGYVGLYVGLYGITQSLKGDLHALEPQAANCKHSTLTEGLGFRGIQCNFRRAVINGVVLHKRYTRGYVAICHVEICKPHIRSHFLHSPPAIA